MMPSQKRKLLWRQANKLATQLIESHLRSVCKRIEVCGSIRRGRPLVNDIELIAEPLIDPVTQKNALAEKLISLERRGRIEIVKGKPVKQGAKYCQFILLKPPTKDDIFGHRELASVDLFIVTPPAQWGVIKLIRTGSAKYSKRFAIRLRKAGYCFHQGALWRKMPVDKEEEVYNHLAWEYDPPEERER